MARIPRLLPLIAIAIGGVVAVRAVGVAPGLFDGAKAWAEEAAPAVAGAPKPALPGTCAALSPEQLAQQAGISPAELKIIQSLSQRRAALTMWAWVGILAAAALGTRFIPFREHGHWHTGATVAVGLIGLAAIAASVYMVYVLEIVKLANPYIKKRAAEQARRDGAGDARRSA